MDADELTYQTHIWMRYELERKLLSGELAVKDLREGDSLSSDRLGLVQQRTLEGCLQDIHWAIGSFGHFPSYGVGAIIAGQLWEAMPGGGRASRRRSRRADWGASSRGFASGCIPWAPTWAFPQLVQHATSRPVSAAPFLRYLERRPSLKTRIAA